MGMVTRDAGTIQCKIRWSFLSLSLSIFARRGRGFHLGFEFFFSFFFAFS